MVTLPEEFIAIKDYPGYFWHFTEKKLYSIKVSGMLKPLYYNKGYEHLPPGYQVSKDGKPHYLVKEILMSLKPTNSVVPVWPRKGTV